MIVVASDQFRGDMLSVGLYQTGLSYTGVVVLVMTHLVRRLLTVYCVGGREVLGSGREQEESTAFDLNKGS